MATKLAPIITPALLSTIRRYPNLPRNTWYFVAATTLSIINRPDEIPHIYKHALDEPTDSGPGLEEQLAITRRIREALIKSAAAINALLALKTVTPPDLLDEPMAFSPTLRPVDIYDTPSSQILNRGQTFFDKVYGKVSKRVMGQMDRSGTEDLGLTARLMYGYVLSNTNVLSSAETSFVLISALIPQDVNPQLKGHLKGALNGGASVAEVTAVRDVVIKICEASGMKRLSDDAPGGWGWRSEVASLPLLREQESSRQSLARLSSRIDALCPDVARIAYGPTNASLDRIDGKLSTSQTSLRGINDELSTIKNSLREINDQLSNSQASLQEALNRNLEAFAGVAALLADIRDSNQAIVSHLTSNNDTPSTS
ncbi:hypothetical protein SAPIO_CDS0517 [Scedosporium apiospermum]|uniref:Carboxymuconolactone decarboxylase-like domain-containing protein n=1 Tax=Pseudallescheria apiosperma TaxID=563466 RepID=A0A084GH67_PSEDA|nr:uncharacterized protein SAPIO_CDS0517 [Scedosporium apiospermum]KEZ46679.1 hypothetical protein SAPIO_CDS0517 [Scedosporium apiospermum]